MQLVVRVAWVLLAICVAMVSFWPLRTGSFVTDDDVFRLTSSLVTHPWSAFYTSHFFEPYDYRPVGLVFWWYAYALMSDSFVGHVFVNVLLHLGNACLLFFCYASGGLPLARQPWRGLLLPLCGIRRRRFGRQRDLICFVCSSRLSRRLLHCGRSIRERVGLRAGCWRCPSAAY